MVEVDEGTGRNRMGHMILSAYKASIEKFDEITLPRKDRAVYASNASPEELREDRRTLTLEILRAVREEVESKKLIEASFPGSLFTLEWKQGHNKALSKTITKLDAAISAIEKGV